jgi:hypothetical protein
VNENDWTSWAIEEERCTPFLGAGACVPELPIGLVLARKWARQHGYPLPDEDDLARVSEYSRHQASPSSAHAGAQASLSGARGAFRSDRRCGDAGLVLAETSNGDRYRGPGFCLITGVGILG